MIKVQTSELAGGTVVLAKDTGREDFGIPLVEPHRGRGFELALHLTVRNHCRARGGTVVWFEGGLKTAPIHGRTNWVVAE